MKQSIEKAFEESWQSDDYHGNYKDFAQVGFKAGVEWLSKQLQINEIDLNDTVSVELTEWGATYLNAMNIFNNITYRYSCRLKTDYQAGDVYQNQLWQLMQEFKGSNRFDKEKAFRKMKKIIE